MKLFAGSTVADVDVIRADHESLELTRHGGLPTGTQVKIISSLHQSFGHALDKSLSALSAKLKASERIEKASAVEKAREKLALSVGKLNSRSTRFSGRVLKSGEHLVPRSRA